MTSSHSQAGLAAKALALRGKQTPPTKIAFTLNEMTELGDGCRSFLYNEINAGRLRAVKRGRRTIVFADAREEWLASLPAFTPKNKNAA